MGNNITDNLLEQFFAPAFPSKTLNSTKFLQKKKVDMES